jgi:6-phosphogluconolactonase
MLKTLTAVLAVAVAFGGGGSSIAQGLGPGPVRSAAPPPARWALTTNALADTASVYAIADGALTLQATVATADAPRSITVHPSGRFAYLASAGTGTLQVFRFNARLGTLTPRATVPLPGGAPDPEAVAVEPLGRFLYVTDRNASTVVGFWIHPLTGALALLPGFPLATGAGPGEIVFDPQGRHAFVSNLLASTVSAYRIEFSGALRPAGGSPFATPLGQPRGLAIDPGGRFLYATHGLSAGVSAFQVHPQGALSPVPGSPFAAGADPIGAATSTDGRALYVSDPALELVLMRRATTWSRSGSIPPGVSCTSPPRCRVRSSPMPPTPRAS